MFVSAFPKRFYLEIIKDYEIQIKWKGDLGECVIDKNYDEGEAGACLERRQGPMDLTLEDCSGEEV